MSTPALHSSGRDRSVRINGLETGLALDDLEALAPGMPVEAYLRTGERSPLSYLVKPLTDYFERSLREE